MVPAAEQELCELMHAGFIRSHGDIFKPFSRVRWTEVEQVEPGLQLHVDCGLSRCREVGELGR